MNQSGLIIFQRIILGLVAFLFACPLILAGEAKADNEAAKAKIQEAYSRLPLSFIKNNGQVDERVKYYEKGAGHAVYFTEEAVYLELIKGKGSEKKSVVSSQNAAKGKQLSNKTSPHIASKLIKLSLINANKEQEIIAVDKQEGKVSYFIGNDSRKWRTNIPTYKGVLYKEAYKGIDIKYYGNNRQMEYDIIVKPGADPSKVRFSYEGIDGLRITGEGELEIALNSSSPIAGGDDGAKIIQKKPIIYQEVGGKRVEVEGRFVIASLGDSGKGGFSYGFQVDSYDKDYPLIIDPVLSYSTFIGGGYDDYGEGIAVDGGGNAYVTGGTYSFNFLATTGAYDTTHNGYYDVFVVKLNSTGTALLYATFIGGSYDDYAKGIAVDGGGMPMSQGGHIFSVFQQQQARMIRHIMVPLMFLC
ncbi:MAG: hypothetical protein HY756_08775 [Nitrospirae bacterium]|nr:hypothetical protein [Nitrospirota bacterium]